MLSWLFWPLYDYRKTWSMLGIIPGTQKKNVWSFRSMLDWWSIYFYKFFRKNHDSMVLFLYPVGGTITWIPTSKRQLGQKKKTGLFTSYTGGWETVGLKLLSTCQAGQFHLRVSHRTIEIWYDDDVFAIALTKS